MMKIGKVKITHLNKELFPGIKKVDFIKYYDKISRKILPYLKDRPLVMKRFPNGIDKKGFYEKQRPDYFPKYIKKIKVQEKKGTDKEYSIINNKDSLIYVANQDCIAFHTWLSKKQKINFPDKMIFDLDPPDNDFKLVAKAGKLIKGYLDKKNLRSFVMSTGSRGIHIIVPLNQKHNFDEVRKKAKKISKEIAKKKKYFTTNIRKSKRKNKLFIDVARNAYGQLSICPYSTRAINKAPIASPLFWEDLEDFNPKKYTIKNFPKIKNWKRFNKVKNSLKGL